jgi:hypothetical protein
VNWKRVKPLKDSIEDFEKEQGVIVPAVLKEVIALHNGGRPSPEIIKTAAGKEVEIKSLLSFNKQDTETIYNVIGYFKERYKGTLLPFASEPSGDYFCMNLNELTIVYWEHETNEVSKVSDSLNEFMGGLYSI